MTARIRVLIADDHALLRDGIRRCLEEEADFQVVGESRDGEETVAKATELAPDVIIMDVNMPRLNGLEATRRIRAKQPSVQVLGLTAHESPEYFFSLLDAGAAGYLLKKDATVTEVADAIRAVYNDGIYLSPTVAKWLIKRRLSESHRSPRFGRTFQLTLREQEVLGLLVEGHSNQRIGVLLSISPATVQTHRHNLLEKLDLHSRADLVKYALTSGLDHHTSRQ